MSLRSSLTKLVGSFRSAGRSTNLAHLASFAGLVGVVAVASAGYAGCGGNDTLQCEADGTHCMICDGLSCRPATSEGSGGSGGGTGTGASTSVGAGGTDGGTGGAAACDPKAATCPCVNGACTDGKTCIDGLCITGCNFSYECGSGKVCDDGACVPGCDGTTPCSTGYTCTNGACALDPTKPQCGASSPCPSGQVCSANGLCTTTCTASSQCATGQVCDGSTGQCITNPSPTPICNNAMPCPGSELCLADGFCHYPCSSLADCTKIDNRFVACNPDPTDKVCETQEEVDPQCTLTKPCPTGKSCISNTCL
jgi:hypothetical protein